MKGLRFPFRSESVPKRKVDTVVAIEEIATIHEMMVGSFAIFAYTKVLNHWFSMFQQSCPAIPSPQTRPQKRRPEDDFLLFMAVLLFVMNSISLSARTVNGNEQQRSP